MEQVLLKEDAAERSLELGRRAGAATATVLLRGVRLQAPDEGGPGLDSRREVSECDAEVTPAHHALRAHERLQSLPGARLPADILFSYGCGREVSAERARDIQALRIVFVRVALDAVAMAMLPDGAASLFHRSATSFGNPRLLSTCCAMPLRPRAITSAYAAEAFVRGTQALARDAAAFATSAMPRAPRAAACARLAESFVRNARSLELRARSSEPCDGSPIWHAAPIR